ncbi:MAG: MBL fold metallo-hydrolase [Bryobacterales bacterium]|nr:MBL fold metallo-hydrolase [Bryobacteraceae bacterium]MDW8130523.1 MBL fold metallo-hydrolase [Bryobacterales bacterium]
MVTTTEQRGLSRSSRRKWLLGGLAGAGMVGLAGLAYRAFPSFWRQYFDELGRPIAAAPRRPTPERWPATGLHAAWLGHATVLLKVDGFWVLTDPIFSKRAGIHLGVTTLGVKRLVEPALPLPRLPVPDLVLLSHAHMDHMDTPTLRRLENPRTAVVLARHTSDLVRPHRFGAVHELGWGEQVRVGPALVRAFPVNHWGARYRTDRHRGYNGYAVEIGRWRLIFGGDTGDTHHFRELRGSRPFHLAIMPIGAYNPWRRRHCTPEEAWRMTNEAGAERILPVHHQTFVLSREPIMEPIQRLLEAAGREQERVAARQIGDELHVA